MTPQEFLAAVLPSPGNGLYCAVELTKNKEHAFADKVEELVPQIDTWHANECDVFFALSTFDRPERKAEAAQSIKAFFIDMDGYATKKDAGFALAAFAVKTSMDKLGRPYIVGSGGGLHVYWALTEAIPVSVWKPVAENFKRLCKQENLNIDMTVTADAARILRVPGTSNFKKKYGTPRPVKLLNSGDTLSFDDFKSWVERHIKEEFKAPEIALPGKRPERKTASAVKLIENSKSLFAPLMEECGQIKDYIANAQEDGKEPIWRGLLSWTKVCEDGEEHALSLSAMHPYSEERMRQKLANIKGPYACIKMDSENPGICGKCPHFGKITNPLILGRTLAKDNTAKIIPITSVEKPVEDFDEEVEFGLNEEAELEEIFDAPPAVYRPEPPRNYSYGENGGVYCEKTEKDVDGKTSTRMIELVPYDLFVVDLLKLENEHMIHMAAVRPNKVETFTFPQKAVVSKDDTLKNLATHNILASHGAGNDKNLYDYVRACANEASTNKKPIEVPLQFGWQDNGSFVYNHRVFTKDGKETTIPMPGLENINRNTNKMGNLDDWRQVWNIFVERKMYPLLANALDSFGCPLMRFTEYEGFTWALTSKLSGTGKSLTLSAKAGVWGHPIMYRTGKGTSPVAMQQRAGLLKSLPLLIDEITSTQRANMEWAPAFIFDFAEGQGKERMDASVNKERLNNTNWASTCTLTSNEVLTDYMAGARKFSSNGELLRMLEWNPTEKLQWSAEERITLKKLKRNYGVAGEAWVRWLVRNQDVAEQMVQKVSVKLGKEMNFTDDERYWHAGCATTIAAAILLGSNYAGILDVPVKALTDALHELVKKARGIIASNIKTAEDVLSAYTGDNYGSFIVIKKNEGRLLSTWGSGDTIDKSLTRSKVRGRVEHELDSVGHVDYFIEEQLLKAHCVAMSFSYADFKDQISRVYKVKYGKKDMLAKTNGPSMRVNVVQISKRIEDVEEFQLGDLEAG